MSTDQLPERKTQEIRYDPLTRRVALPQETAQALGRIWVAAQRSENATVSDVLGEAVFIDGSFHVPYGVAQTLTESLRAYADGRKLPDDVEREHASLNKQLHEASFRLAGAALEETGIIPCDPAAAVDLYQQFSSQPVDPSATL